MLILFLAAFLAPAGSAASGSDIVVVRVGDGSATLTNAATPVFLERRTSTGALVAVAGNPTALPTAVQGSNARFTLSGSASSEGAIARSANALFLTLAGYDAAVGTASVSGTTSATANRVVARFGRTGTIDTSTKLNSAFTGTNVRGAVTGDGSAFWVSGAGTTFGGCWYVTLGSTGGVQILTTPANMRTVAIFGGQLYGDSSSSPDASVFTIGSGEPTMAGATATVLPNLPTTGASPYAFVFFDRSALVSGFDTLYIADDGAGGGIQKWTFDGMNWNLANSFGPTVRGLAGETDDSGSVVLYATTTEGSANKLIRVVDDGSMAPAPSTIATAAADTVFRGVALAPDSIFFATFD